MSGNGTLGGSAANSHRSLQELVSINAWFVQDNENPDRLTLHADVSFSEERLGGGPETQIVFKLAVKRCDIIFCLPSSAPFRVDASSVCSPRPLNPKSVFQTESSKTHVHGGGTLSLSPVGAKASADLSASKDWEREQTKSSEQVEGHYHELWKMVRGNHAWSVDGRDLKNKRLAGPVFDAHNSPRLTIVDRRTEEARKSDALNALTPVASITVRCLREDIDIYDLAYKDPDRQKLFETGKYRKEKELAAREVLKEALLREGLVSGDIANDPYAEMTICDVSITIIDSSA